MVVADIKGDISCLCMFFSDDVPLRVSAPQLSQV